MSKDYLELCGDIIGAETDEQLAEAWKAAYDAGYRYAATGCNLCTVELFETEEDAVAHRRDVDGVFDSDKQWCGGSGDGIEIIEYEMTREH